MLDIHRLLKILCRLVKSAQVTGLVIVSGMAPTDEMTARIDTHTRKNRICSHEVLTGQTGVERGTHLIDCHPMTGSCGVGGLGRQQAVPQGPV